MMTPEPINPQYAQHKEIALQYANKKEPRFRYPFTIQFWDKDSKDTPLIDEETVLIEITPEEAKALEACPEGTSVMDAIRSVPSLYDRVEFTINDKFLFEFDSDRFAETSTVVAIDVAPEAFFEFTAFRYYSDGKEFDTSKEKVCLTLDHEEYAEILTFCHEHKNASINGIYEHSPRLYQKLFDQIMEELCTADFIAFPTEINADEAFAFGPEAPLPEDNDFDIF